MGTSTVESVGQLSAWVKGQTGFSNNPEDNWIYNFGKWGPEAAEIAHLPNSCRGGKIGFFFSDVPKGLGSAAGFVVAGGAYGKGAKVASGLTKTGRTLKAGQGGRVGEIGKLRTAKDVDTAVALERTAINDLAFKSGAKSRTLKSVRAEQAKMAEDARALHQKFQLAERRGQTAGIGVTGGLVQASEGYNDALMRMKARAAEEGRELTADDYDKAFEAWWMNIPGGMIELWGVEVAALRAMKGATKADDIAKSSADDIAKKAAATSAGVQLYKNLDSVSGGRFTKGIAAFSKAANGNSWIRNAAPVAGGFTREAIQEASQGAWLNMVASYLSGYDENRKLFDGLIHQGGVGGAVGAIFGILTAALGGRRLKLKAIEDLGKQADKLEAAGNVDSAAELREKAEELKVRFNAEELSTRQEADEEIKQADEATPVSAPATETKAPVFGATPHHTYAIELDPAILEDKKFKKHFKDYKPESGNPIYYVGSTASPPGERAAAHELDSLVGNKAVAKYKIGLVKDFGKTFASREEAEAEEVRLAQEHRVKGFGVLGGGPATTTRSDKSKPVTEVFGKPAAKGRHAPSVKQVAAAKAANVELSDIELTDAGQVTKTRLQRAIDAKSVPVGEGTQLSDQSEEVSPSVVPPSSEVVVEPKQKSQPTAEAAAAVPTEMLLQDKAAEEKAAEEKAAEEKAVAEPEKSEETKGKPDFKERALDEFGFPAKDKEGRLAPVRIPRLEMDVRKAQDRLYNIRESLDTSSTNPARPKGELEELLALPSYLRSEEDEATIKYYREKYAEVISSAEANLEQAKEALDKAEGTADEYGFPAAPERTEGGLALAQEIGKVVLAKTPKFAAFATNMIREAGGSEGILNYVVPTYEQLRLFQSEATKKKMDSADVVNKQWPGVRSILEETETREARVRAEEGKASEQTKDPEDPDQTEGKPKTAKKKAKKKKALTPAEKKAAIIAQHNAERFGLRLPKGRVLTKKDVIAAMGKDVDRSLIFFNPDGTSIFAKGAGEPASLQDLTSEELKARDVAVKHLERLIELDNQLTNALRRRRSLAFKMSDLYRNEGAGVATTPGITLGSVGWFDNIGYEELSDKEMEERFGPYPAPPGFRPPKIKKKAGIRSDKSRWLMSSLVESEKELVFPEGEVSVPMPRLDDQGVLRYVDTPVDLNMYPAETHLALGLWSTAPQTSLPTQSVHEGPSWGGIPRAMKYNPVSEEAGVLNDEERVRQLALLENRWPLIQEHIDRLNTLLKEHTNGEYTWQGGEALISSLERSELLNPGGVVVPTRVEEISDGPYETAAQARKQAKKLQEEMPNHAVGILKNGSGKYLVYTEDKTPRSRETYGDNQTADVTVDPLLKETSPLDKGTVFGMLNVSNDGPMLKEGEGKGDIDSYVQGVLETMAKMDGVESYMPGIAREELEQEDGSTAPRGIVATLKWKLAAAITGKEYKGMVIKGIEFRKGRARSSYSWKGEKARKEGYSKGAPMFVTGQTGHEVFYVDPTALAHALRDGRDLDVMIGHELSHMLSIQAAFSTKMAEGPSTVEVNKARDKVVSLRDAESKGLEVSPDEIAAAEAKLDEERAKVGAEVTIKQVGDRVSDTFGRMWSAARDLAIEKAAAVHKLKDGVAKRQGTSLLRAMSEMDAKYYGLPDNKAFRLIFDKKGEVDIKETLKTGSNSTAASKGAEWIALLIRWHLNPDSRGEEMPAYVSKLASTHSTGRVLEWFANLTSEEMGLREGDVVPQAVKDMLNAANGLRAGSGAFVQRAEHLRKTPSGRTSPIDGTELTMLDYVMSETSARLERTRNGWQGGLLSGSTAMKFEKDVSKVETVLQKRARGVTAAQPELLKLEGRPYESSGEKYGGEPSHFDHIVDGVQLASISEASIHAELISQLPGGVILEPKAHENQAEKVVLHEHAITIGDEWMKPNRSWVKNVNDETVDQIAARYNTTTETLLRNNPAAQGILDKRGFFPNGTKLLMHGQPVNPVKVDETGEAIVERGGAAPDRTYNSWVEKAGNNSSHKYSKRNKVADAKVSSLQAKLNAIVERLAQASLVEDARANLDEAKAELEATRAAIWTATWDAKVKRAQEKVARFEAAHKVAERTSQAATESLEDNLAALEQTKDELAAAQEYAEGQVKVVNRSSYDALSRKGVLESIIPMLEKSLTSAQIWAQNNLGDRMDQFEAMIPNQNDSANESDSLKNAAKALESTQQEFADVFSEPNAMRLMDSLGLGISTRDLSYLLDLVSQGHPVSGKTVAGVSAVETKGRGARKKQGSFEVEGAGITAAKKVQQRHNDRVGNVKGMEARIKAWKEEKKKTTDPKRLRELDGHLERAEPKVLENNKKWFDGGEEKGRPVEIIKLEAEDTRRMLDAVGQMLIESITLGGMGGGADAAAIWRSRFPSTRAERSAAYEAGGLSYFRDLPEDIKMRILRRMLSAWTEGEEYNFPSGPVVSDKVDNIFDVLEEVRAATSEEYHKDPRRSRAALAAEEKWKVEHRTHVEVREAVTRFENVLLNQSQDKTYSPNQSLTDPKATLATLKELVDEITSRRTQWSAFDYINLQTAIVRSAQFLKDHKNWAIDGEVRELNLEEMADIEKFYETAREIVVQLNSDLARTQATQTSRNEMLGDVSLAYGYLDTVLKVQHKHFGDVIDEDFVGQVVEMINVASAKAAETVVTKELMEAMKNTGLEGADGDIADLIRAAAAAFEIDNDGKQRDYVVPSEFKKKFNELLKGSRVKGSISADDLHTLQTHVHDVWNRARINALRNSFNESGLAKGNLKLENLKNSAEKILRTRDLGKLTVPKSQLVKIPNLADELSPTKVVTNLWDAVAPAHGIGFSNDKAAKKIAEIGRKIQTEKLTPAEASDLREVTLSTIMQESWIDPWNLATDLWFAGALSGLRTFGDITTGGVIHGTATTLGAAVKSSVYGSTNRRDGFDMAVKYVGALPESLMGAAYIIWTGDLSKLPDANARLMKRMSKHDYYGGESLEAKARQYKERGLAWYHPYRLHSNLKVVRRLVLALDYVGATAGRRAMILYGASTRLAEAIRKGASPEVIKKLEKSYEAAKTMNRKDKKIKAAEKAKGELTDYNLWKAWQTGTERDMRWRYDELVKARTREILEEDIGHDLIASSSQMGRVFALNSDPIGFGAIVHGGAQSLGFLKYGTGLAFSRAAINMAAAASNYAPVLGWVNFFRASPLAGKLLALKWKREAGSNDSLVGDAFTHAFDLRSGPNALTPERASAIQIQATMGFALMGLLWSKFDDDEEEAWEIHGDMRYLSRGKRSQLMSQGVKPYSIKIGDGYYSFKNSPMAGVLSGFGRLQDERRYMGKTRENTADKLMGMATHGYAFTFDVGPASHFVRLLDAVQGRNEAYSRQQITQMLFQGWAGPVISPNLFREMDTWLDDKYYKPGKGDHLTPMWSQLVVVPGVISPRKWGMKPMLNVLGEPVEIRRTPEERFVKFENKDPVWQALAAKTLDGVFLPVSRGGELVTADGEIRDMTPDEQYLYQQRVGQAMRVELERNLAWFRRAKPEDAKRYIDRMSRSIKKRVTIEMGRETR